MKFQLITLFALGLFLGLSSSVLAGENCDSMKGHKGKWSAEEMQQFKQNHAWIFSKEHKAAKKSQSEADSKTVGKRGEKLVEI